jgi:fumarylacetoacetase
VHGEPVSADAVREHVFGYVLLNDWSARDIQAWEYQPLGPFLSKNFATTLSPWIVTLEALAPFRAPPMRPAGDPQPLPYLDCGFDREAGAFDLTLEVWLQTAQMRAADHAGARLSQSSFRDAYWTVAQMLAHHTVNGCNLQSGDLLGSGTLSGPASEQGGSLLELTGGAKKELILANGERRTFLEDGDTVILRGWCDRPGYQRIGSSRSLRKPLLSDGSASGATTAIRSCEVHEADVQRRPSQCSATVFWCASQHSR